MIEVTSQDATANGMARISSQPIALAAGALVIILLGIGSIALWRAYTGTSPEQERIVAARQLQVRAAQASEQLVEKTKGLEATQQEAIDQLQVVQDQLQTLKRLFAAQQADAKRLADQVAGLTEAIDGLRQSFASTQATEASSGPPSTRNKSIRTRSHPTKSAHGKHAKSRG
jgi:peptidoglycan hydrolase CwlO-like protein